MCFFSQVHIFSRTSYFQADLSTRGGGGGGAIAPYAPHLPAPYGGFNREKRLSQNRNFTWASIRYEALKESGRQFDLLRDLFLSGNDLR